MELGHNRDSISNRRNKTEKIRLICTYTENETISNVNVETLNGKKTMGVHKLQTGSLYEGGIQDGDAWATTSCSPSSLTCSYNKKLSSSHSLYYNHTQYNNQL